MHSDIGHDTACVFLNIRAIRPANEIIKKPILTRITVVTAIAAGTATITATLKDNEEVSATVDITVEVDEIEAIEVVAESEKLYLDGGSNTTNLTVKAYWAISGAKAVDATDVDFALSEDGIVTIDANGTVTAVA